MENPQVALFVTCLVDLFRPSVGFASIKLLEDAGCLVEVPKLQSCCGQPAYNTGDLDETKKIAKQVIETFESYDYVIVPSGSCAGMLRHHYPMIFTNDNEWLERANKLAERSYELLSFLTDVLKVDAIESDFKGIVTYHDSCSGLRELSIYEQPRKLMGKLEDLHLRELPDSNVCCGFGGTFCVKYADISDRMVENKVNQIIDTGAQTLLSGDLGCLMNIAGKLQRMGSRLEVRHVAEVLAGMTQGPAIGEPNRD